MRQKIRAGRKISEITPLGLEPRQRESKSLVLPLHHGVADSTDITGNIGKRQHRFGYSVLCLQSSLDLRLDPFVRTF